MYEGYKKGTYLSLSLGENCSQGSVHDPSVVAFVILAKE